MKIRYSLIIFFSSIGMYAQSESLNNVKYQFAQDVFKNKYKKVSFEKFTEKIEATNISVQYEKKNLVISEIPDEYKAILITGIFYPNIITGNYDPEVKSNEEIALMTTNEKVFYNMMRNDSLRIGYLDELKLLNPNSKVKRFVFWLFTKGRANAIECYFELENLKANDKTPMSEFIKNSRLTFYYKGTLII